jgi:two-component system cell cycle sensor histidine kinase/response regulator CckA
MILSSLKRFGVVTNTLLITLVAVVGSVLMDLLISKVFLHEILSRGILIAALIPAIMAPLIACIFLHVTKQLALSEADLRKSEERYRMILETIKEGYYETDLRGNFTFFNPSTCEILGCAADKLLGLSYRHLVQKDHVDEVFRAFNRVYSKGGAAQHIEWRHIREDGSVVHIETSATLFAGSNGKPAGFRGIIRDVSERKEADAERIRLQAQLQQAQKMEAIGTLAGGIAHDFNNLLMAVQGNVSLMLCDAETDSDLCKRLKNIEKQVTSGAKLTSQLLGYARKGKYELKPFDLNKLIRETAETFGRAKKEIKTSLNLARDLLAVEADPSQVEQVLLNVFVNAWQAMPEGGELRIRSANVTEKAILNRSFKPKPGHYAMIMISDTGTGMDKETMARIFEPFFTTKGMGRGTGLGLASAYGIVKSHGGYIDVESKKGAGSTCLIYFPVTNKPVQEAISTTQGIPNGNGTILLVDDEEAVLQVGAEMLKRLRYQPFSAKDGTEAVKLYQENLGKIDLVILDMIMPGMSGGQTFDKIREIHPDARVLLSSGYSIEGQAREILNRGCCGFIQKPFTMSELSTRLQGLLPRAS